MFSKYIEGIGRIQLRHVKIEDDLPIIYQWLNDLKYNCTYKYYTLKDLYNEYEKLVHYSQRDIYMGLLDGEPIFLMDKFKSINDEISKQYTAKESDYGMRFLIAPTNEVIRGFSWHVLTSIVDFFFSYIGINRIVTYLNPTENNYKGLFEKVGFEYLKQATVSHKQVDLFICYRNIYKETEYSSERLFKDLSIAAANNTVN